MIDFYDNSGVRRQDRLLDIVCAEELLRNGEYGYLSMVSTEGKAYGLPLSYAWDGKDSIYIHCAPEGKKLKCIENNPDVSFCITGNTHVIPDKFTTEYESLVIQCRARTGLPEDERMEALRMIVAKYSPAYSEIGEKYARGSFLRTEIIRLDIERISGKSKSLPPHK